MNAGKIINILFERDAEEFISSLPKETWHSFSIIHDGDENIRATEGYLQNEIVYKNNADGTREFIGYLVQASNSKYYPSGVARPRPGRETVIDKLDWAEMTPYGSENKNEVARYLMAIYTRINK